MKITIDNLGKVGHAEICLDGITVIAGDNGSGKSTISRTLAAMSEASSHIDDWVREERIRSLYDETARILGKNGIRPRTYIFSSQDLDNLLTLSFWNDREAVERWINHSFARFNPSASSSENVLHATRITDSVIEMAKKALATPDVQYDEFVLGQLFNRSFGMPIGTLSDSGIVTTLTLDTEDEVARTLQFKNGKLYSFSNFRSGSTFPAFYVDPLHLLDAIAKTRDDFYLRSRIGREGLFYGTESEWSSVISPDPSDESLSFESAHRQSAINEELDKIVSTLHGELQKEEREIKFFDADFKSFVPVRNMASGAKTMAMLIRGLRNGRIAPDGLVIIDEPETNLHPEWQIRFAEFLVLLHARFSLRLLLNTHSPYFLKAVQTYSDRLDVHDACRCYKLERKDNAVLYSSRDVTDDIESVFADMSRPYAKLLYGDSYDGNPSW